MPALLASPTVRWLAAVRAMVAKAEQAAPEPGALPAYTTRDVDRTPWRLFG